MPDLAIVMPAYGSQRTVLRSLDAFRREAPDAALVLVDSAPDGASAGLAASVTGVRVVRSDVRLLPHAARNLGARQVDAPLLLFTDPDVYPRPGAVAALRAARDELDGAAVASFACFGRSWVDRGAHVAKFAPWLPGSGLAPVTMAPTAGLLVTRADWERIGGLPEDDIHGDTLFSWSLVAAGVRLTLVRDAVFEHDHGTSVRELVRERYARGRDFAPLRRLQRPSAASRLEDVAATATLVRPARVTARSVAAAARSEGTAEALATLPVVAAGQLAWFAGELAGLLGR